MGRTASILFGVLGRNPSLARDPRRASATIRAMNEHLARYPRCAWCGSGVGKSGGKLLTLFKAWFRIEVHHFFPIHVAPDLAADPNNLVSLCRWCHWTVAHMRSWTRYVHNLRGLLLQRIEGKGVA